MKHRTTKSFRPFLVVRPAADGHSFEVHVVGASREVLAALLATVEAEVDALADADVDVCYLGHAGTTSGLRFQLTDGVEAEARDLASDLCLVLRDALDGVEVVSAVAT